MSEGHRGIPLAEILRAANELVFNKEIAGQARLYRFRFDRFNSKPHEQRPASVGGEATSSFVSRARY